MANFQGKRQRTVASTKKTQTFKLLESLKSEIKVNTIERSGRKFSTKK